MYHTPNGNVLIEFTAPVSGPYAPKDRAAFSEDMAKRMVREGVARFAYPKGATKKQIEDNETQSAVRADEVSLDEEFGESTPDVDDPLAEIKGTSNWRKINGNTLRSIAHKVSDAPINSKFDAIAVIEEIIGDDSTEE